MELRHLRYFVTVAEELHFTRAAARLHIAQPPLSQQIRQLERDVGTRLLNRSSRHVELTPAGEAFLAEARAVLDRAEQARAVALAVGSTMSDRLDLGFVDSALHSYMPPLLRAFRAAHPLTHVALHEQTSALQIEALQRGNLAVGIVRRMRASHVRFEELGSESLVLALPADHDLARKRAVPVADLEGVPIVLPDRSAAPGLYDHLTGIFRRSGVPLTVADVATEGHTMIGMVAAGVGLSIVTETMAAGRSATVSTRPLLPAPTPLGMYVAWRVGDRSTATLSFLEVARRVRDGGAFPRPSHGSPSRAAAGG